LGPVSQARLSTSAAEASATFVTASDGAGGLNITLGLPARPPAFVGAMAGLAPPGPPYREAPAVEIPGPGRFQLATARPTL
jgi:hypothetical protein